MACSSYYNVTKMKIAPYPSASATRVVHHTSPSTFNFYHAEQFCLASALRCGPQMSAIRDCKFDCSTNTSLLKIPTLLLYCSTTVSPRWGKDHGF